MPESTAQARLRRWLVDETPLRPQNKQDAEVLWRAAGSLGLAGLLHEQVHSNPAWPAEARARLRNYHRALLKRGVVQLDLLERTRRLLEHQGLRSLPLKGAALAESAYGSVATRPMADVDLLVLGGEAWEPSVALLEQAGFEKQEEADHAWRFLDPGSDMSLELHHSVTSCPGFFRLDAEGLWQRSRPGPGQVSRLPSPEDLLLHLCQHAAFQHGLVLSLVQHLDMRRVLERLEPDLELFARHADRAHARGTVALALLGSRAVVGMPLDAAFEAKLQGWLPRACRGWLSARKRTPMSLVAGHGEPDLLRLRWALAGGRRMCLLRGTLGPRRGADGKPMRATPLHVIWRALHVVRHWVGPALLSASRRLGARGPRGPA